MWKRRYSQSCSWTYVVKQLIWDVRGSTDFSSQCFCAGNIVEGPCCDQIKGSSFVWQTPQGRSSGQKSFCRCFEDFSLFLFFPRKKGCEALSRRAPCKEAIKSSALWRSRRGTVRKTASWSGWNGKWNAAISCLIIVVCCKFTKTACAAKETHCLSMIKCIRLS